MGKSAAQRVAPAERGRPEDAARAAAPVLPCTRIHESTPPIDTAVNRTKEASKEGLMSEREDTPCPELPPWSRGCTGRAIVVRRSVSYEEVVHVDRDSATSVTEVFLQTVTQWALTLKEILQDRRSSELGTSRPRCLCAKADQIVGELNDLRASFANFQSLRSASSATEAECELKTLLGKVQSSMRSAVSIRLSQSDPELFLRAKLEFTEMNAAMHYADHIVKAVVLFVYDAMDVFACQSHCRRSSELDEEISKRLECLSTQEKSYCDEAPDTNTEGQVESGKDPLTRQKKRCVPPMEPTKPMQKSKKPRRSRSASHSTPLDFLERNRKAIRTNGLYQFVLWRQAVVAEKARLGGQGSTYT